MVHDGSGVADWKAESGPAEYIEVTSASIHPPRRRDSRNIGRLFTACTRATMVVDAAREVINHAAPTPWSQVPRFEATLAIQSARKTGWRRARQFMGGRV